MDQHRNDRDNDMLARLIRLAGRRENPPREAYEETLAIAAAAWQQKARRHRRKIHWTRAAAALLLAGVIAVFITDRAPVPGAEVARLARAIGTVETRVADDMAWHALVEYGEAVNVGNQLRTGPGSRAGIRLLDGVSLRLAAATEVVFDSGSRVRLVSGKVYVDTGVPRHDHRSRTAGRMEIVTKAGTARDLGTQFEVQYAGEAYRLRVREGRVVLARGGAQLENSAGEQLTINADGHLEKVRVAPDDPEWQWAESVASAPEVENEPVTMLLEWVARETGRTVRYARPELQKKAAGTILHGSIRYLAPLEALDVMLATTDLAYDLSENGTILIRLKTGS